MTSIFFGVLSLSCLALSCAAYWHARKVLKRQGTERESMARAHRIVMDFANAYRMPDDLRKVTEIRRLREAVQQYSIDACASMNDGEVVQVDGAEVFNFNKVKQIVNGRSIC
ncbi:hypothetical protein [Rheinheimera tilapiae]|uniref:DUF945 family protein n=1 Tax=Rheinheimera tilapiae TaxID=875043 RepID=A0ABV6BA63_9GAMM